MSLSNEEQAETQWQEHGSRSLIRCNRPSPSLLPCSVTHSLTSLVLCSAAPARVPADKRAAEAGGNPGTKAQARERSRCAPLNSFKGGIAARERRIEGEEGSRHGIRRFVSVIAKHLHLPLDLLTPVSLLFPLSSPSSLVLSQPPVVCIAFAVSLSFSVSLAFLVDS